MGGDRETVVKPATTVKSRPDVITGTNIRIHENQGEVHFHDDKADDQGKIKVAVEVATFETAWNKYKEGGFTDPPLVFIDHKEKTVAHIQVSLVPAGGNQPLESQLIVNIRVERIKIDDSYSKFLAFAEGK